MCVGGRTPLAIRRMQPRLAGEDDDEKRDYAVDCHSRPREVNVRFPFASTFVHPFLSSEPSTQWDAVTSRMRCAGQIPHSRFVGGGGGRPQAMKTNDDVSHYSNCDTSRGFAVQHFPKWHEGYEGGPIET
jgi:hypothetical protein